MIDDKKIIGMLQAKALGCLDESDDLEFQNFINSGYVFPWNELGVFQNTASLLPLTLQLEIPEPELKDKVALKLIRLSEELKAKKLAEEEQLKALEAKEIIEEEVDEKVDEYLNLDEPFVEPPIEIETEIPQETPDIKFSEPVKIDEPTFNLDDIELPGYESDNLNIPEPEINEPDSITIETKTESLNTNPILDKTVVEDILEQKEISKDLQLINTNNFSEPIIELEKTTPSIEELKSDVSEWIEPKVQNQTSAQSVLREDEEKLIEEVTDPNKPDFTKRSVAEKAFKTLEQDFDMLKYHNDEIQKKTKRNLMIAYLVIAFLAALVVVFFFKFNSDINQLQKEIDFLKSRPSSNSLPLEKSTANFFS